MGIPRAPSVAEAKRRRKEGHKDPRVNIQLGKSMTAVIMGDDDPATWDNEELIHGRRRDVNGEFRGKDPNVVSRVVYDEMVRRVLRKANNKMAMNLDAAIDQLVLIIKSKYTEDRDRLKAIDMLMTRVMGRTPEKIEITAARQPWENLVVSSIVATDDNIIETTAEIADGISD